MRKFVEFLAEAIEDVKWTERTINHVRDGNIPLTKPMFQRVLGDKFGHRVVCFHTSDVTNAVKLLKLQGTKKSVSVSHKIDTRLMNEGVWSGTGVLTKLEGTLQASANKDIMSRPDNDGTRWVSYYQMADLYCGGDDCLRDELSSFMGDMNKLKQSYAMFDVPSQFINKRHGEKATYRVIKSWYEGVEQILKKYPKLVERMFFQVPPSKFVGGVNSHPTRYAESVVSEIKVLEYGVKTDNIRLILEERLKMFGHKVQVKVIGSEPSMLWDEFGKV